MISSIEGGGTPILEIASYPNQRVFFVSSDVDDAGLPPHAFRILFHLHRRIGNADPTRGPGIDKIAKICRMKPAKVIQALQCLEKNGYFTVTRSFGKRHRYDWLIDTGSFFLHSSLDEFGLSIAEFRVLGHMTRLSGKDGDFFINKSKFAQVCGLHRETINETLLTLKDKGLFCTDEDRNNPRCYLTLFEAVSRIPRSQPCHTLATVDQMQSHRLNNEFVEMEQRSLSESDRGMPEGDNGHCTKGITKGSPSEGSPSEGSPKERNPAPPGKPVAPAASSFLYVEDEILNGFEKDPTWSGLNIRQELAQMQTEKGRTQIKASNFVERLLRVRRNTIFQTHRI